MKKSSLNLIALVAFATLAISATDRAVAQSTDTRRVEDVEKENAALRARLRRLEVENENTNLRNRVEQLEVRRASAPREATTLPPAPQRLEASAPAPRRLEASAPDRTLILADMNVKAPPAIAPRLYDWTGFYVGGNIGYSVGNDRTAQTLSIAGGVFDRTFTDLTPAPRGVVGGAQFGYNWQGGRNWLVGFEADIQGASQVDRTCSLTCVAQPGANDSTLTVEHKIDYFGTVRARLGAVNDNVLFYATGGAAYGGLSETARVSLASGGAAVQVTNRTTETRFGWTAGAGIEGAIGGNWTAKVEYLYLNLGDAKINTVDFIFPGAAGTATLTTTSSIRDHIVRAGVNYRFGDSPPLSAYASANVRDAYAGPAPVYNWTGVYLGGNAGYGAGVDRLTQTPNQGIVSTEGSTITPKGFAGGVQLGYNWQGGRNWLVGFEADIQGTNQDHTACSALLCFTQTPPPGNDAITMRNQIDWFGTVRGRIGAVNNNILFYATGGAAFGRIKETVQENFSLGGGTTNSTAVTSTFNQLGWTAGGGIEAAVAGNWTAKAEYLYLNLGTIQSTFADGTGLIINNSTKVQDHIFRAGVNYRFSGMPDRW
jgi:outer membrane immunogenic protein